MGATAIGYTTLSTLIVSTLGILGGLFKLLSDFRDSRRDIKDHLTDQDVAVREIRVLVNGRLSEALHAAETYAQQLIDSGIVPHVPVPVTVLTEPVEVRPVDPVEPAPEPDPPSPGTTTPVPAP